MMPVITILMFAMMLLPGSSAGQGVSFTASVDRTEAAVGDAVELTITLSGATGGRNFRPPAMGDFSLISGPNQSTNMQFVNGQVSSSITYSYVLQAKAPGKFTIGPAAIEYDGKQFTTTPITISVVKGAAAQPKQQGKQSAETDIGRQIGDNLFLRTQVDKSKIYQGEQITVTYKIYTRVSVVNYTLSKLPALTGFWSEDLEVPKQIQLSTETIDGKQYRVGILKKSAIFPQRSGALELDPMEVDCVIQVQSRKRSNDIFDQFFNDPFFGNVQNINHKVRSEPVKITVLPLPSSGSSSFSGAVGKFEMESWLDKRETRTNEPVTLKVKITGRGNLKLLGAPAVNVPPDIERYDPKISDNIAHQGDRLAGSRTFEYLLIPRHAGDQHVPSFAFTYFDPEKKGYVTLRSPEFGLKVAKGSDVASGPATGFGKEDVKLLGEDIRFIKSGESGLRRAGGVFFGSPMFFILSVGPGMAFIGFLFIMRRREKVAGDIDILRNRRARRMAQKRLAEAKKFLDARRKEEFYAEISRAVWGYLSDKLTIPPSDLSVDMLRNVLEARKVSAESIGAVASTLEQCEFARFAPAQDAVQMDAMYRQTVEIIAAIEDQLR